MADPQRVGHPPPDPSVARDRLPRRLTGGRWPRRALTFRLWTPDTVMETGAMGIDAPPAGTEEVVPRTVVVPLLAFDRRGYRLGYGGGYYDRTLAGLRDGDGVLAVGVGYAAQEVAAVPVEDHDARLDAIVTEAGVLEFGV